MDNLTFAKLKKTHPENASEVWSQVCQIGGFGDVDANYPGGLNIGSLPDDAKARILKLTAVDEKTEDKEKTKGGK